MTRRFEGFYRMGSEGSYFAEWHNREFFLVGLEVRRLLHVARPVFLKEFGPCCAITVPSSPVFAYKAKPNGRRE